MVPVHVEAPTSGVKKGDVLSVTFTVASHANGEVLLETSGDTAAVRYRAGHDCGPTCTNASLRLDPGSGLLVDPVERRD